MLFRSRDRVIYTMDYLGPTLRVLGYRVIFESHGGLEGGAAAFLSIVLKSDLIVGTNSFIVKKFINAGYLGEKTLVSPNGVDLENFIRRPDLYGLRGQLGLPNNKRIIAYVGKFKTMGKGKGVEEIVEAFARVLASTSDVFLMIVGIDKCEREELSSLIDSYGIPATAYRLFLQVSQVEIADYLGAADVLVMNYPRKEHYEYFMSPMKMFEYMASGRPIVSTDLPSVREVLNETNAVLVEPEDIDSLSAGILRVLNDRILAEKLSTKAREDVKQYTWDKRARKILDFISSDQTPNQ